MVTKAATIITLFAVHSEAHEKRFGGELTPVESQLEPGNDINPREEMAFVW